MLSRRAAEPSARCLRRGVEIADRRSGSHALSVECPHQQPARALVGLAVAERRRTPEQVLDRRTLRTNPPPLLVTNLTMLEYMLVRRQDVPILEQSRGLLEYVILDEVHTYVGAQATELALLLRRVALAFGRDPRTIRVIATSATLGTGDRHEQAAQLRQFLRDLTGAADGTVHAIIGERAPLDLPPGTTPQRLAPAT